MCIVFFSTSLSCSCAILYRVMRYCLAFVVQCRIAVCYFPLAFLYFLLFLSYCVHVRCAIFTQISTARVEWAASQSSCGPLTTVSAFWFGCLLCRHCDTNLHCFSCRCRGPKPHPRCWWSEHGRHHWRALWAGSKGRCRCAFSCIVRSSDTVLNIYPWSPVVFYPVSWSTRLIS